MGKDLFERERRVIAAARSRSGGPESDGELLVEYEKLLKTAEKLIRINDRNHIALRKANQKIQDVLEDLQRTQAELVEAGKLAALGGLVAGVAHEVNTPLGVIVTGSSALAASTRKMHTRVSEGVAKKSDVQRYVDQAAEAVGLIEKNAARAARLIESFKTVAVDRTSGVRRAVDLMLYVEEVCASLAPEIDHTLHSVKVEGAVGIVCDTYPGAVSQIVTNLVINALRHAFRDGVAGHVTICVDAQGDNARLICTDDGVGVPEELRQKIFEPFFTTGRDYGGSGLGLYLVHNLATGVLGGQIRVTDTPSGGGSFELIFPLSAPKI